MNWFKHLLYLIPPLLITTSCLPANDRVSPVQVYIFENPFETSNTFQFNNQLDTLNLQSAQNEYVTFQIAIHDQNDFSAENIEITEIQGIDHVIPASSIQLYRVLPVKAEKHPAWYIKYNDPEVRKTSFHDILMPARFEKRYQHAEFIDQANLQPFVYFIEIYIPKGTPPGHYVSKWKIKPSTAEVEEKESSEFDVHIEVLPFVLPDHEVTTYAPLQINELNQTGKDNFSEIYQTCNLLRAHQIEPIVIDQSPSIDIDSSGNVQFDWQDYIKTMSKVYSSGLYSKYDHKKKLSLFDENSFSTIILNNKSTQNSISLIQKLLAGFEEEFHLEHLFFPVFNNISTQEENDRLKRVLTWFKSEYPEIPVVSSTPSFNLNSYGYNNNSKFDHELSSLIDIHVPVAQFYLPDKTQNDQSVKNTWFQPDRPPFSGTTSIFGEEYSIRAQGWQYWNNNVKNVVLKNIINSNQNLFLTSQNQGTGQDILHSEFPLIYQGYLFGLNENIPSIRLKWYRRAMTDISYARLVSIHGFDYIAHTLGRKLTWNIGVDAYRTHFADGRKPGWQKDLKLYSYARDIMSNYIMTRVNDTNEQALNNEINDFESTLQWRQFIRATQKPDINVEGVKVTYIDREQYIMRADCSLVIHNHSRIPWSGSIKLGSETKNHSWKILQSVIPELKPGQSKRVIISFEGQPFLSQNTSQEIQLVCIPSTSEIEPIGLDIKIPLAAAVLHDLPVQVDGDLSEWPLGSVNVLSNFRSCHSSQSISSEQSTTSFVLRDEKNLYIAAHCRFPKSYTSIFSRGNAISYEDMIPFSDDMIEFIIDPLHAGTRSPADLYHIVIFKNGALINQKGVPVHDNLNGFSSWSTNIRYAIKSNYDSWSVELSVPFDSFDMPITNKSIWGFNVARLESDTQFYTNWSGANFHPYDPLSLGNLCFP